MNPTAERTDRRLGWVLLAAAVLQAAAPIVQSLSDVSQPSDGSKDLLITPAGWAFSIWSLIYLLAIVHAVVTIWRGDGTGSTRFVVDLIALYVGAAVWIAVSAAGISWATFLVLVLMTGFAIDAARIAAQAPGTDPGWIGHLARATSGIYAGWVTVAVFLNFATGVVELDLVSPERESWQITVLAGAAIFALGVNLLMPRSPGYAAATIWAQIGVIAAVAGESTWALGVAIAAIVLLLAQTAWQWRRVVTD
ncbi:hypothetical protein [Aeromicrobium duanguangcaii]|uniref:MFS transporter n=1 Tax=Aeromicrobium duanguangcaii TaxID=2968086 RepID=A0ABY5KDD7_9ACTN|nr:hypothetical protein [Aeromicrobium duanguangcaii]MCD9154467.1 hypothetical protein [Aeromicrobium duanguangcaii]MCL3838215.1 hypothetical protein [Aeromicrobium duanguangcaii]UUI68476.1 hypothetical protein NP095_14890 [Aeromicrobium duanguangcaii]